MSAIIHNGHKFYIVRDIYNLGDKKPSCDIYDDEGYRRLANFDHASLSIYQRAVELSGEVNRNLKIVLDFAPYTMDGHTLRLNDRSHSLWVRPEYKELPKFWKLHATLKKHPSSLI